VKAVSRFIWACRIGSNSGHVTQYETVMQKRKKAWMAFTL
jgi:hypothetical protein